MAIDPATEARLGEEAFEAALARLRYGSVCVNVPTITGFSATSLVWGAYPGAFTLVLCCVVCP